MAKVKEIFEFVAEIGEVVHIGPISIELRATTPVGEAYMHVTVNRGEDYEPRYRISSSRPLAAPAIQDGKRPRIIDYAMTAMTNIGRPAGPSEIAEEMQRLGWQCHRGPGRIVAATLNQNQNRQPITNANRKWQVVNSQMEAVKC